MRQIFCVFKCFEIEVKSNEPKRINDDIGWWYRHTDGTYTTNGWEKIGSEWFYFDDRGYAAKENLGLKQIIDGITLTKETLQ